MVKKRAIHPATRSRLSRVVTRLLCYDYSLLSPRRTRLGLDARANRRGVGPPRKYLPRKKIPADLRSLARGHTELCIKVLAGIVSQEAVPPAARVSAAGILLDRGWGRPAQPMTGEDGGGEIQITIRDLVAEAKDQRP